MKRMAFLAAVVLVLAVACAAGAYPTLGGPTGLLVVPTTDVTPVRTVDAAFDWANLSQDGQGYVLRGLFGAVEGLEVGAAYTHVSGTASGRLVGADAKLQLRTQPRSSFGLAVGGVLNNSSSHRFDDDNSFVQLYAVASKDLTTRTADLATVAVRVRANVWLLYDSAEDEGGIRPFVGVEFTQAEGGQLLLEYQVRAHRDISSIALRYPLAAGLSVQAGMSNLYEDSHQLTIGAAYRWGLGLPGM